MIDCRDLVPESYSDSRDYQTFLRLLDIIVNVSKSESDNVINLYNPDKCPDKLLPLLASNVGYVYDKNESYDRNRTIIKYFKKLIRNRGNETGIGLATALAMNTSDSIEDVNFLNIFRIDYEYIQNEDGKYAYPDRTINNDIGSVLFEAYDQIHARMVKSIRLLIYYPGIPSKLYDLIEVVRPAGLPFHIIPAKAIKTVDKIDVYDYTYHTTEPIDSNSNRFKITGYDFDENGKPRIEPIDNPYSIIGDDGLPVRKIINEDNYNYPYEDINESGYSGNTDGQIQSEKFKNKNRIGFGEVHDAIEESN